MNFGRFCDIHILLCIQQDKYNTIRVNMHHQCKVFSYRRFVCQQHLLSTLFTVVCHLLILLVKYSFRMGSVVILTFVLVNTALSPLDLPSLIWLIYAGISPMYMFATCLGHSLNWNYLKITFHRLGTCNINTFSIT